MGKWNLLEAKKRQNQKMGEFEAKAHYIYIYYKTIFGDIFLAKFKFS